jgi:putative nucleotidyltransferase with HDIG domain
MGKRPPAPDAEDDAPALTTGRTGGENGMERVEALELVRQHAANENMVRHMLATEAIMRALAARLGEDPDRWGLAGLLHDLDASTTEDMMEVHGTRTVAWLREAGLDDAAILQAILAHNPGNGSSITCPMDRALFAADPLTGLVTAAALIRPEKQLSLVQPKSLKKRFKEPSFARGARREDIATCEELGIPLDEFLGIGLQAMQGISGELGL